MPSAHANDIIRTIQDTLGARLDNKQQLMCEELVLNVYPGALKRFIKKWASSLSKKQGKVLTFDHFYAPVMNGMIVGAAKRPRGKFFKFDTPSKRMMYAAMHSYLGTNFSMRDLEDILWFIEFTQYQELQTAISVAEHHGVVNCAYVRAIVVGNRRKAAAQLRAIDSRFKKITDDPPDVLTGVPNVKSLQDAWTKRLKAAIEKTSEADVERQAQRKLSI